MSNQNIEETGELDIFSKAENLIASIFGFIRQFLITIYDFAFKPQIASQEFYRQDSSKYIKPYTFILFSSVLFIKLVRVFTIFMLFWLNFIFDSQSETPQEVPFPTLSEIASIPSFEEIVIIGIPLIGFTFLFSVIFSFLIQNKTANKNTNILEIASYSIGFQNSILIFFSILMIVSMFSNNIFSFLLFETKKKSEALNYGTITALLSGGTFNFFCIILFSKNQLLRRIKQKTKKLRSWILLLSLLFATLILSFSPFLIYNEFSSSSLLKKSPELAAILDICVLILLIVPIVVVSILLPLRLFIILLKESLPKEKRRIQVDFFHNLFCSVAVFLLIASILFINVTISIKSTTNDIGDKYGKKPVFLSSLISIDSSVVDPNYIEMHCLIKNNTEETQFVLINDSTTFLDRYFNKTCSDITYDSMSQQNTIQLEKGATFNVHLKFTKNGLFLNSNIDSTDSDQDDPAHIGYLDIETFDKAAFPIKNSKKRIKILIPITERNKTVS